MYCVINVKCTLSSIIYFMQLTVVYCSGRLYLKLIDKSMKTETENQWRRVRNFVGGAQVKKVRA